MNLFDDVDAHLSTIGLIDTFLRKCIDSTELFYTDEFGYASKLGNNVISPISNALCVELELLKRKYNIGIGSESYDRFIKYHVDYFLKNPWVYGGQTTEKHYPVCIIAPVFIELVQSLSDEKFKELEESIKNRYVSAARVALEGLQNLQPDGGFVIPPPEAHSIFLYRLRKCINILIPELKRFEEDDKFSELIKQLEKANEFLVKLTEEQFYFWLSTCAASPTQEEAFQLSYLLYSIEEYNEFKNDVITRFSVDLLISILFGESKFPKFKEIIRSKKGPNVSASPIEVLSLILDVPIICRTMKKLEIAFNTSIEWLHEKGREIDGKLIWYASPWRPEDKPESWINAQVIFFLLKYKEALSDLCNEELLSAYSATFINVGLPWDKIRISDDLLKEIESEFIAPISNVIDNGSKLPVSSMILYGPSGTSKTTLARAIANELKWPFVEILPHHFAERGIDGVISCAKDIFSRLLVMKKCVVLLDEVEELFTSRIMPIAESRGNQGNNGADVSTDQLSRFITASMLPWFQKLRHKAEIILIVATNNIMNFDDAIKRPGRFDLILPIGPPDATTMKKILIDQIEHKVDSIKNSIVEVVCDLIDYHNWTASFGELKILSKKINEIIKDCSSVSAEHKRLIDQEIIPMKTFPKMTKKIMSGFEVSKWHRYPPKI